MASSIYNWNSSASNWNAYKLHLRWSREGGDEVNNDLLQLLIALFGDLAVFSDGGEQGLMAGLDVRCELLLEGGDLAGVQFVQVATDTAVNDGDLTQIDCYFYEVAKPK